MTRKTVPYKGEKYHYYYCPTGKKNGCDGSASLKERDLQDSVLESVRAFITNIASLESLLDGIDAGRIARELAGNLTAQVSENEARLEKIRVFKAGLYENYIGGILNKEEYKSLKDKYSEDADALIQANTKLRAEIENALSCKHERMAWINRFREFAAIETIDRKAVINLIQSIKVCGKNEIEIYFNYQAEYDNAVSLLRKEVV